MILESSKQEPDRKEKNKKSLVKKFGLYSRDSGKFWNDFKQSMIQLSERSLWLQCGEWVRGWGARIEMVKPVRWILAVVPYPVVPQ